ncbi:hypothetical protein HN51_065477 [Arachis hypogaea]
MLYYGIIWDMIVSRSSIDHEPYNQIDAYRKADIDTFPEYDKFRDGYGSIENYGDRGYDKPARFGGHDRDDYAYDDYGYKSRASHHRREDSHERDYKKKPFV